MKQEKNNLLNSDLTASKIVIHMTLQPI